MAVIATISFSVLAPVNETIQKLTHALTSPHTSTHFVIGPKVQEPNVVQITSEWPNVHSLSDLEASLAFGSFTDSIHNISNSSLAITLTTLDRSPFADGIPPLVEYVQTDFSVSSITPTFQAQIEADFARFEALYRRRGDAKSTGEIGLALGWGKEQDSVYNEGNRERVRPFIVVRGWESMGDFERAVQSEEFKEAIPILLAWGAPFKLWHVERQTVIEQEL